jgi:ubiquitin carboxyl-terminal hydrolase 10
MCFANAVLQLLVHSPPFWNLSKVLGDLKRQRGADGSETGATPLADATARFFEEFMFKDKEPPPTQQAAGGKAREGEEAKQEHNAVDSFEPTYMYEVIKKKRPLSDLLVCSGAP